MGKKVDKEKIKKKVRFVTCKFRAAFLNVFKPVSQMGGKPQFTLTMLIKKDIDLAPFRIAMKYAKIAKFGPEESNWPDKIKSPIKDGDKPKYAKYEGHKGHYAIKSSSNEDQKPGVVDAEGEEIISSSDFKGGDYARAQVYCYVYEFPEDSGNFGYKFILDHVQKLKDGKAFGGKGSAKDAFGIVAGSDDSDNDDDAEVDDAVEVDEDELDDADFR